MESSTDMNLTEIGAMLREARERKGLSIDAVEDKTKIAPSVIMALEEGNRVRFPHPVYARGFVRSYALLLGLDAAELCAHFSREYPVPTETEHPEANAPQITVRMHDSGRADTILRIVAILGILALGALGWYAFDVYRSRQSETPAQEPPLSGAPAQPAFQPPVQTAPAESLPAPLTQMQEVAAEPTSEAVNASVDGNTTSDSSGNGTGADLSAPTGAKPAPGKPTAAARIAPAPETAGPERPAAPGAPPGGRTLRVTAHAASWLQARPDDKVVDYFLRKGESTTITFSTSLSVKFGNAGGVMLELDGHPYPFEAALGEVRTLVVN